MSKLTAKQRERNRIQQELFKTVGGRGRYCWGSRTKRGLGIIGSNAPVTRGGYLHNGNWRPLLRAY